ncbi:tryptophan-rich sensory protein [Dyadobacter sp. CY323]|uniref:tryptophan-rich sensory protein n=1 Tax=Dyadobacter sp. CY323 TaxID=2907302 RepID=UPI001F2829A5|nr:tryptophan-rich sensory protein [Dyadobacter sp. CY323]MCE6989618.1 tryptophan-rich sensory protein [Dyadobacter sp. CY323]
MESSGEINGQPGTPANRNMQRTLQIANIVVLVVTIIINYLSNTGIFNGNTMASVSASYQNYFTPAGYAFSIWGIIYAALTAFVIHQSKGLFNSRETPAVVMQIGWTFVVSCIANCLWVIAWLYDYTGLSVLIMLVILGSLIRIVMATRMEMELISLKQIALECWPFAIYLGWINVALIANTAAYLTKIEWDGFGISAENWTIIMLIAAAAINIALIWTRNLRESAAIGIWGIVAVAVANWDVSQAIAYTAIAAAIVIFVVSGVHGYLNRGRHFVIDNPKYSWLT